MVCTITRILILFIIHSYSLSLISTLLVSLSGLWTLVSLSRARLGSGSILLRWYFSPSSSVVCLRQKQGNDDLHFCTVYNGGLSIRSNSFFFIPMLCPCYCLLSNILNFWAFGVNHFYDFFFLENGGRWSRLEYTNCDYPTLLIGTIYIEKGK